MSRFNEKFKKIFGYNDEECEKLERISLVQLALLKTYWNVEGGIKDDDELDYIQDQQLEVKLFLMMMHTQEANDDFIKHENGILSNVEIKFDKEYPPFPDPEKYNAFLNEVFKY